MTELEKSIPPTDPSNHIQDENTVDWNGPHDPKNPLNWRAGKRRAHVALVSSITLVVNLATTMFSPGASLLMKELSVTSTIVGSLTVSIYVLGFALGPLALSPLSELYGRLPIYHACNVVFLAFTVGCALSKDVGMFLAFRFLAGCAGSAPLTIGGGTIADLFPQDQRGAAMGSFAMGPLLGPIIGPIAGGFITQDIGWRWTFWIILIVSGVISILTAIFMRETYAPVLLARKTAELQKSTANPLLRSKLDKGIPPRQLFAQSVLRPTKLLIFSPIVLLLSLYTAFAFGLTYLLFVTFPAVFQEQYHFRSGVSGLAYLGMGIGFAIGIVLFGGLSDRMLRAQAAKDRAKNRGSVEEEGGEFKFKPEYRLPLMVYFAPILPIGFFWYGWAAETEVHWIVPILGTSLIGTGSLFVMMPTMTYLVDCFGAEAAASALAANTVLRSLFGAFLPMAGPSMYDTLGLGWGNSLLGFIGIAFIPIPFFFWKYGERIRQKWPVNF